MKHDYLPGSPVDWRRGPGDSLALVFRIKALRSMIESSSLRIKRLKQRPEVCCHDIEYEMVIRSAAQRELHKLEQRFLSLEFEL